MKWVLVSALVLGLSVGTALAQEAKSVKIVKSGTIQKQSVPIFNNDLDNLAYAMDLPVHSRPINFRVKTSRQAMVRITTTCPNSGKKLFTYDEQWTIYPNDFGEWKVNKNESGVTSSIAEWCAANK